MNWVGQWMWSWHYGMEEAAALLEEHGYLTVLDARMVQVDPEDDGRVAGELEKQKQEEEEYYRRQESEPTSIPIPFLKIPVERAPYGYVLVARRAKKAARA